MNWKHWAGLAVLFLIGYLVGKNFTLPLIPSFGGGKAAAPQGMQLPRSSVIFAALLVGFIVYITVRGELPIYIGFLTGKKAAGT